MPRRVYLLGLAVVLVGGALTLTHELLGPWQGVNERNARRIKRGMTMSEVETLLGGPGAKVAEAQFGRRFLLYHWEGAEGVVAVWFEPRSSEGGDLVLSVTFEGADGQQPLQRLRDWLGW
jgi:hypothetical protein